MNSLFNMKNFDRRSFLKTSSAAAVGAMVNPSSQTVFANTSANDRPQVACIGFGGMGLRDSQEHAEFGDVVALCDVDSQRLRKANQDEKISNGKADLYNNYKAILDRKDIDVVSVVTVDHWHVKIAVEALEAGKHVFCQKPLTITIEEGKLINAARAKHPELAFLVGTQQRSTDRFLRAVNMVQKGLIGKVNKVSVRINGGQAGGPFRVSDPPKELDWEQWQGQTPDVDYIRERCHYTYRWWYEYTAGKFTDWGAHHIDIALWALNRQTPETAPVRYDGTDANHPVKFVDGYPTHDRFFNTAYDFDVLAHFEDGLEMSITSRGDNGILFEGEKGRLFVNRGKISGTPIEERWDSGKFGDAEKSELYKGKPYEGHKDNFYRCIREGGETVSDVASHVATMDVCHSASIAARLGRELTWDRASQRFGDEQANTFLSRTPRKGYEILRV